MLESTWLSRATKVRLTLRACCAIELKFFGVGCSCERIRNRFELGLNGCLLLLEVLVRCVLHSPNLGLIIVVVVIVFLHLFDILISKVLWFLLLNRLALRILLILVLRLYVDLLVLHLDVWVCLMILIWFRLAYLGVVGRLLEIISLSSVVLTLSSSSQVEEILFVMFVSSDIILLISRLNYILFEWLLNFVLCFNIVQKLFRLHE